MSREDLHVHTNFSDGKNSPEEMVLAAIEKGMTKLGFTDHSYTSFDESYCIAKDRIGEYREQILALKEKYADKIEILCGIEQDYYCDEPTEAYDYVIGSVHYIKAGRKFIPVDETAKILKKAARRRFKGDIYTLIEEYYRTVSLVVEKTGADIIGHFDLITKFNETGALFDESHPRYVAAWQSAAKKLLESGKPFEINTGAMSRGYRTSPYPAMPILTFILENGGSIVVNSDSHSTDTLCYGMPE